MCICVCVFWSSSCDKKWSLLTHKEERKTVWCRDEGMKRERCVVFGKWVRRKWRVCIYAWLCRFTAEAWLCGNWLCVCVLTVHNFIPLGGQRNSASVSCPNCLKSYTNKSSLTRHKRVKNSPMWKYGLKGIILFSFVAIPMGRIKAKSWAQISTVRSRSLNWLIKTRSGTI